MRIAALLRGVNLGRARRVAMADLRAVVSSLGHTDVETYLQSGNVVFVPTAPDVDVVRQDIARALHAELGVRAAVQIRTGAELAAIVAANPYPDVSDPTKLVVTFLDNDASLPDIDLAAFAPESCCARAREIYLKLPSGQARSPLLAALAKVAPDDGSATTRNWRTVLALDRLCSEPRSGT